MDRTNQVLAALDPEFAKVVVPLVLWSRHYGVPLVLTEGRRDWDRQQRLVRAGRSERLKSYHLRGRAVDVDWHNVAPDRVPIVVWELVGAIGEALGLRWGGRWSSLRDFRHFER